MEPLLFVCKPDKNGVYSIGERYINLKKYADPSATVENTILCPVCNAFQRKHSDGICAVCGFNIFRSDTKDLKKFKEENKEKIQDLQKNYGR